MKLKAKTYTLLLFVLIFSNSFGQFNDYKYQRELTGIKESWHKLELPNDLFEKVSSDFSDIRIIGITKSNDTIEVPYIINLLTTEVSESDVNYKLINQTSNNSGYYFTFELQNEQSVNQLKLEFQEQNFDWKTKLEGSTDQIEWFTINDDFRILSIHNNFTNYSYTTLSFSEVKYKYLRLLVKSKKKPNLLSSKITEKKIVEGSYNNYEIHKTNITNDKDSKSTIIDIELKKFVPISYLNMEIKNDYDYYRPITLKYLIDSTTTPKGQIYNYRTIGTGILSSFENPEFSFRNIKSNKIRLIINNNDNQPLDIGTITLQGNKYELVARFVKEAKYYFIYGNANSRLANYDIKNFTNRIPENLQELTLGDEFAITKNVQPDPGALFQNKIWLWLIMVVIVLLLGWFSIRMLKK